MNKLIFKNQIDEISFNENIMNGMLEYKNQNFILAIQYLEKALSYNNEREFYSLLLAMSYEKTKNDEKAKENYLNAWNIDKSTVSTPYWLGMLYFRQGELDNAISYLEISNQNSIKEGIIDPKMIKEFGLIFIVRKKILSNLGTFLIKSNSYEKGFEYLFEAIKLDENYSNPYMSIGIGLNKLGRIKECIPYVQKAGILGDTRAEKYLQMMAKEM